MSFLRRIFPFLFKSESKPATTTPTPQSRGPRGNTVSGGSKSTNAETGEPIVIAGYGIIARVKNARGLRKDSKVYIRAILDGDRLRVRGTAPNGQKVTLALPRRSLKDFESEGVPEHIAKHYDRHSIFNEEDEAKMKAEALGKH